MENHLNIRQKENGFIDHEFVQQKISTKEKEENETSEDYKNKLIAAIVHKFKDYLFDNLFNDDYLLLFDILHFFFKSFLMPRIRTCTSLVNQNLHFKEENVSNAKTVQPGDVLYTGKLMYIIVKDVVPASSNTQADRLSIGMVYSSRNGSLTTKAVLKDTFSLQLGKSVIHVVKPEDRKLVKTIALQEVSNVIPWRSYSQLDIIKSARCINPSMIWSLPTYKASDILPGNIVSFLHQGRIEEGVVVTKRPNHHHMLTITYYHVNSEGIVSEGTTTFDLDDVIVKKCVYVDLDGVVRRRLLHTARQMNGLFIPFNLMNRSLSFVLGCLTGDIVFTRELPIFISLQQLQLSTKAFPRIENIETWMKNHSCLDVSDQVTSLVHEINLNTTVLVLSSSKNLSAEATCTYFKEEEIDKINKDIHSSPETAIERVSTIIKDTSLHCVFIIELHPDENGQLRPIDQDILFSMKQIISTHNTVYTMESKYRHDIRLTVSEVVQSIVYPENTFNRVYNCMFYKNDPDIEKRISLYAERDVTEEIWRYADDLEILVSSPTGSNSEIVKEEIHRLRQEIDKLKSFSSKKTPDLLNRHMIEVLLQRQENAPAFSIIEGKMNILTNETDCVKQYLKRFLSNDVFSMIRYEEWPGKPIISMCHTQQGSKIIRSKEKVQEYGTLGFFLHDDEGNFYFTTCAHVIAKGQTAYAENKNEMKAIGKSIYSPPPQEYLSITETPDLSVVHVDEDEKENCGFGIRNPDNTLVQGSMSVADISEMENMHLYKWGAKTQLTRGIYKGSVFVKSGEKFKSHLHYIQGHINAKEFAEGGDSGSLICFEATESPQFPHDTAALIFVGELLSGEEYKRENSFVGSCYHVKEVFKCKMEHIDGSLQPHFTPNKAKNTLQTGAALLPSPLQ